MKRFFKINFFIVLFTIFLIWLSLYLGFPWLKGCAQNLNCPDCEACFIPKFPRNVNFYLLPFIFILYLIANVINSVLEKRKSFKVLKIVLSFLPLAFVAGLYYFLYWRGQCRAFSPTVNGDLPYLPASDGKLIALPEITKCPDLFNPFEWNKFQLEYGLKLESLLKAGE